MIGREEKSVYFGCNLLRVLFWGGSGRRSRPVQWAGYLRVSPIPEDQAEKTSRVVEEMPL